MKNKSAWEKYGKDELKAVESLSKSYKAFLDGGKTERECIKEIVAEAEAAGYEELYGVLGSGRKIKAGDKLYAVCMKKTIALFNIGSQPLEKGMNILGAHIDSPRLDVKGNPLYESNGQAYLDTHYYGGIKKYLWVAQPMAIHGVVCRKDGSTVELAIGEDPKDPVFVFTDLLIHLSHGLMEKKASEVVSGENLDLLVGNTPLAKTKLKDDEKEAVRANVLSIIKKKYGFDEEDFLSAELEIVPAGKARDCGLDAGMILAYGHDDRICAYTSLKAMLEVEAGERTTCCLLVDKEEIGSVGATGMSGHFFENAVAEIVASMEGESALKTRRALQNSRMLSSDVDAAYDPLYAEAYEAKNSAYMSCGLALMKFTGSRGKSGSNDANAEYIARIRKIFDDADVSYQFSELGKVDVGGGGTIAYIMAKFGMEVIDSGIALFNMHAPYEVASKADIYEAYKGYKAFLK